MKTKKKTTNTKRHKTYKLTKRQQDKSQKSIRIITITTDKNDCKNDMNVYIDIFKKLNYKIDIHILDTNPKIRIKYAPNPYYDINLFIDRIAPADFNIKTIFPSRVNIFASNVNTESELRNQIYALQKCSQSVYVPKSNSDLYNYKFQTVSKPNPHELLFRNDNFSEFNPNPNVEKIGSSPFYNNTRVQVRDTTNQSC